MAKKVDKEVNEKKDNVKKVDKSTNVKKSNKKKLFSKKTIVYIEAVVYILAIIVAIFACYEGNIYIKMLPILFILGFIGRIIFDRPVITTFFGIAAAVCIIQITSNLNIYDNLLLSLFNGLNIALGELFGEYYLKIKKNIKKKKKLKHKGVLFTYIVAIIVLVVSVGVHLYTSGDIISYIKARESLKEYITEVYPDSVFKIVNAKYTFYKTKSYTFEVRNISKNVNTNFIVLKDKNYSVYDEYKFNVQSQNTTKLNESFDAYVKEINTNLTFKIGYLDSGEAKLLISKEVESVDKETQDQFVTEVVEFISNLKKFNENGKIKFVEIYLKDKTNNENSVVTDFTLKDIYNSNNMYEYIQNSLTVEIIG